MNRHGSSRDRLMRVSKAIKMQGKKNVEFIDRTKRRFVHICQEPNKKKKRKGKNKKSEIGTTCNWVRVKQRIVENISIFIGTLQMTMAVSRGGGGEESSISTVIKFM